MVVRSATSSVTAPDSVFFTLGREEDYFVGMGGGEGYFVEMGGNWTGVLGLGGESQCVEVIVEE